MVQTTQRLHRTDARLQLTSRKEEKHIFDLSELVPLEAYEENIME